MDLNHITIYTTDTKKAVKFYLLLGFQLIVDSLPRYARFELKGGSSTFSLHETINAARNDSVVIYLECEDVDAEYKRLADAGIEFENPPSDQSWLWREAQFSDPDGNRLILYHAGENRKNPPWRISQTESGS